MNFQSRMLRILRVYIYVISRKRLEAENNGMLILRSTNDSFQFSDSE